MVDPLAFAAVFAVGAFLGFGFGAAYIKAKAGWNTYSGAKKSVPVLRKLAWKLIGAAFSKGGLVFGFGLAAVILAAVGDGK